MPHGTMSSLSDPAEDISPIRERTKEAVRLSIRSPTDPSKKFWEARHFSRTDLYEKITYIFGRFREV